MEAEAERAFYAQDFYEEAREGKKPWPAQQPAAVAPTTAECPHDWGQDEAHEDWARCYKCGVSRRKPPAHQPAAVDGAVGTITRVGSFEVQEHRIELDPEFDERLNNMPAGTVVHLYAAPVRDLTQQQLAVASAALADQQGGSDNDR